MGRLRGLWGLMGYRKARGGKREGREGGETSKR